MLICVWRNFSLSIKQKWVILYRITSQCSKERKFYFVTKCNYQRKNKLKSKQLTRNWRRNDSKQIEWEACYIKMTYIKKEGLTGGVRSCWLGAYCQQVVESYYIRIHHTCLNIDSQRPCKTLFCLAGFTLWERERVGVKLDNKCLRRFQVHCCCFVLQFFFDHSRVLVNVIHTLTVLNCK